MTTTENSTTPIQENSGTVYSIGRATSPAPEPGKILVSTDAHSGWSKGWCALLVKSDRDSLNIPGRVFLESYKSSLSRAGNGAITYAITADGYYEAESVVRSYESGREVFRVVGGEIYEATMDEALAYLNGMTLTQLAGFRLEEQQAVARERAERSKAAAREGAASGLPALKGSEKQIAWAETIRATALAKAAKLVASAREAEAVDAADSDLSDRIKEHNKQLLARYEAAYAKLSAQASARVWIDTRNFSARALLEVSL